MALIERDDVYKLFSANGTAYIHSSNIDTIPIVDAVPVVRCCECEQAREIQEVLDADHTLLLYECDYSRQTNRGHEFCSWGKRKIQKKERV